MLARHTALLAIAAASPALLAAACRPRPRTGADRAPTLARADSLPAYPAVLRTQDVEGAVELAVAVDASGRVPPGGALPVAASNDLFALAARSAARRWVFAPAVRGGRAAADTVRVRVEFALDSGPPCPPRPRGCPGARQGPAAPPARVALDTAALRVRVVACRYWPPVTCVSAAPGRCGSPPGAA